MTQRRTPRRCPHGDGSRPYPAWGLPGYELGDDPELDAALTGLENALTACDFAFATALSGVTAQDVSTALRALPLAQRPSALRPLSLMIKPRQINQALCQDVRARLGRVDAHAARHSAAALTLDAFYDIIWTTFKDEFEDTPWLRDPVERWGEGLCRLAVWANGLASARDARVWLWAAEQPWFRPDGLTDEQLTVVAEQAARVVTATPGYRYRDDAPGDIAEGDDDSTGEGLRDAVEDGTIADVTTSPPGNAAGAPIGLAEAASGLEAVLAEASTAALTTADRLAAGRAPAPADLETLQRARREFDDVIAAFAAAGSPLEEDTVDAVREAAARAAASAGDADSRRALQTVRGLQAPEDQAMLAGQLAQVHDEAAELLGQREWSEHARAQARSLVLLLSLAEPGADATARMPLVMKWSEARPELSFLALHAQQLAPAGAETPEGPLAAPTAPAVSATAVDAAGAGPEPATHAAAAAESPAPEKPAAKAPPNAPAQPPGPVEPAAKRSKPGRNAAADAEPTAPATPTAAVPEEPPAAAETPAETTAAPVVQETPTPAPEAPPPSATGRTELPTLVPSDDPAADPLAAATERDPIADEDVAAAVARLVRQHRLGLAAAVGQAAGWSSTQRAALRVAALASVVRHQNGAVAAALAAEFEHLDPVEVASDHPSLLLAVPALLRTALVTGEPASGALLTELASRVEPNLSDVAAQVGKRALHGVLIGTQALSVLADVTEVERGMRAITATAQHVRTRHRTLRFKRATDISKVWLDPRGILGKPLSIVERNETALLEEVAADIERLSDHGFIKSELDTLDRRFQGASGKPIEGSGRQDLLNLVQEALKPLADWIQAVRSLGAREARAEHWAAGEVGEMRTAVLARRDGVLAALAALADHGDPLVASASEAAAASLTATFGILAGTATLPVREPAPALVLTAELLKVPGVTVDSALEDVSLPPGASLADLLAAADRTWDDALTAQVDAENFEAARFLLDAASAEQLPADGRADQLTGRAAAVEQAETAARAAIVAEHDLLMTTLRHARLNNEISDEQDGELAGLLDDARRRSATRDLTAARAGLRRVAAMLPEYRAQAKARLTVRLEQLQRDNRVDEDTCRRVTRLMDDGQLSTAEELIYFLEIDEDVPEVRESHDLGGFFPAVPDALPKGLTKDLVLLVTKRGVVNGCPALDYTGLSQDIADQASDALNNWRQMSGVGAAGRGSVSETTQLLPALRMIGLDTGKVTQLRDWPRSSDRRFIEVAVNNVIGKALAPAFGSKLVGGGLHVLLAWGQPSAELLLSWADGDPSGEGLLIAHFGTMSAQTRRDLAVRATRRSAPIVVLDDAALAYLAAHGNRQMTATMNVLLPFSSVNPYLRQKRGVVAPEMFYGRDQERRSVLDPDGTQLVFGGRGLGKSALLNSAADEFRKQSTTAGERVAVYLDLKAVGIRAGSPIDQEAIWDALVEVLTRNEVLTAPARSGRRASPREQVQAGVQAWLDVDKRRRLLVLLDEADQFFEADMPDFLETTRLKSLGQESNSRVKVVFAGLHSVQRYAKTARNAPFGHMAQRPTVIGPLRPQHAANLLTRPLGALGFRFEDPDLVNRVLGFCSYQPFLLQIFANRLIEAMHGRRGPDSLAGHEPPYVITRSDVESVEEHADLKADIRAAFHETLNLDHRYGVIAHVLAHHAHEHGLDARLSDKQLREECLSYWPTGFAKLDVEAFRAYLQEMTGLGVLAPNNDGRGWHLRSANVLSMIGTREDVEAQLVTAAELSVPDEFLALESRHELPSGRRSPLTAAQLDDVLGDHSNQVRVVLGSRATGVDHVAEAVRAAAETSGNRFTMPPVASRRQFEEQLVAGRPGERRVVLDDLVGVAPNEAACCDAVVAAQTLRPSEGGVTRSAVIVAGPDQFGVWRQIFAQDAAAAAGATALPIGTVSLRRYDAATLRVWSLETNLFTSEERREELLRKTGGWPMLVERAAKLVKGDGTAGVEQGEALRLIAEEVGKPDGAAALVDAVGLTADESLVRAFEGVLSVIDSGSLTRAELEIAAGLEVEDPDVAVECLLALQVFDTDADGKFVPEPLLLSCWPHRA